MKMTILFWGSIFHFILLTCGYAWDSAELQMFDLVDDVKMNFYDFLNISETASVDEIKKAYRRLSVRLHPDRNPGDPNANDKFRQLVGIYEVLKEAELREKYDYVLRSGLPDWRNAVFYYRKLRKMSSAELFTLFAVLATTIHYAVLWGSRYEKLWNMKEQLSNFYKLHKAKDKKREAIELEIADHLRKFPKPKWHDILPFAICKGIYYLVLYFPLLIAFVKSQAYSHITRFQEERKAKRELIMSKERAKLERHEKKRRQLEQKQNEPSPYDPEIFGKFISITDLPSEPSFEYPPLEQPNTAKEWTADDVVNLVRAIARFPGGVPDRWLLIAQQVERPVSEVIAKSKQLGEKRMNNMYTATLMSCEVPAFEVNENAVCGDSSDDGTQNDAEETVRSSDVARGPFSVSKTVDSLQGAQITGVESTEIVIDEPYVSRKKQKEQKQLAARKVTESRSAGDCWTQVEQKQLEVAIRSIDKSVPERWDRITECVPTKTKAEVMQRVKHLSNLAKARTRRT